jgi:hypothetical protein
MRLRTVRPRHVEAMLDDLGRAGLSPRREAAIVEALHALYAFALERRLVAVDPLGEPERRTSAPRPRGEPAPTRTHTHTPTPTPTVTMLALGARVAFWTTFAIMAGFLLLLVALILELG